MRVNIAKEIRVQDLRERLAPTQKRGYVLVVYLRQVLCVVLSIGTLSCGSKIGDSCKISNDCSQEGDRLCDLSSPGGYCTVLGCDHDTCPNGSVCIRFFSSVLTNLPCDPTTEDIDTDDCAIDDVCTLAGICVPRSSEVRYCMSTCDSEADCRVDYECRDFERMQQHGGQPVDDPEQSTASTTVQPFCAPAPQEPSDEE